MHDKVQAYAVVGLIVLLGLIVADAVFGLAIVPEDVKKAFWMGLIPLLGGGAAAFFYREGHAPTK